MSVVPAPAQQDAGCEVAQRPLVLGWMPECCLLSISSRPLFVGPKQGWRPQPTMHQQEIATARPNHAHGETWPRTWLSERGQRFNRRRNSGLLLWTCKLFHPILRLFRLLLVWQQVLLRKSFFSVGHGFVDDESSQENCSNHTRPCSDIKEGGVGQSGKVKALVIHLGGLPLHTEVITG